MAEVVTPAVPVPVPADPPPSGADGDASVKGESVAERKAEAERRRYHIKVDGSERDLDLTDDEIAVHLQKSHASDKRFGEAAEIRKAFQRAVDLIKKDPFEALKDPVFGLDLEKAAEERLYRKYQDQIDALRLKEAPEDEKARIELELKVKEQERRIAQQEEDARIFREQEQARQMADLDARTRAEIETEFIGALETQNLPKTPEALWHMADAQRKALEDGWEMTPSQLASEVRRRIEGESRKLTDSVRSGLKGDDLLNMLGEDVVKEVLRTSVAKVRAAPTPQRSPSTPRSSGNTEERARVMTRNAEFWKSMRR